MDFAVVLEFVLFLYATVRTGRKTIFVPICFSPFGFELGAPTTPGTYQVQVYVIDWEGLQSNVLSTQVTAQGGTSCGGFVGLVPPSCASVLKGTGRLPWISLCKSIENQSSIHERSTMTGLGGAI